MNTYYLVRHGEKEKITGDPSLTPIGKKQAENAGNYLRDKNMVVIYCSPFLRTKETAEEINKFLNIEIAFDKRLLERANWGDVKNQPFEEFLKEWYEASKNRNVKVHGRPSSFGKGEQVKSLILEICKKYPDQNIVFVTHGGAIGDFVRNEFGDEKIKEITKNDAYLIDQSIKECSITKVTVENNKFSLDFFAKIK